MVSTLTLADGRKIDLKSKKVVGAHKDEEEEAADESESLSFSPVSRTGVKLEDLPSDPKQMNVVCAVIGYRLLGISDSDIQYALGCTDEQLFAIVNSDAFSRSWDLTIEAFVKGQTQAAKDIIAGGAMDAAKNLVTIARKSKSETTRLKAIDSVLNRVGIGESAMDNPMAQGLVIKVIKDTKTESVEISLGGK